MRDGRIVRIGPVEGDNPVRDCEPEAFRCCERGWRQDGSSRNEGRGRRSRRVMHRNSAESSSNPVVRRIRTTRGRVPRTSEADHLENELRWRSNSLFHKDIGGEGGIRTPGPPEGTTDFESAPFGRSGTSPGAQRTSRAGPQSSEIRGRESIVGNWYSNGNLPDTPFRTPFPPPTLLDPSAEPDVDRRWRAWIGVRRCRTMRSFRREDSGRWRVGS